jgi:hypothetical protein
VIWRVARWVMSNNNKKMTLLVELFDYVVRGLREPRAVPKAGQTDGFIRFLRTVRRYVRYVPIYWPQSLQTPTPRPR